VTVGSAVGALVALGTGKDTAVWDAGKQADNASNSNKERESALVGDNMLISWKSCCFNALFAPGKGAVIFYPSSS